MVVDVILCPFYFFFSLLLSLLPSLRHRSFYDVLAEIEVNRKGLKGILLLSKRFLKPKRAAWFGSTSLYMDRPIGDRRRRAKAPHHVQDAPIKEGTGRDRHTHTQREREREKGGVI
ncbi:hypothetical protein J3Q64DRAFT_1769696, partial [Phycomyces blakesleeanus]